MRPFQHRHTHQAISSILVITFSLDFFRIYPSFGWSFGPCTRHRLQVPPLRNLVAAASLITATNTDTTQTALSMTTTTTHNSDESPPEPPQCTTDDYDTTVPPPTTTTWDPNNAQHVETAKRDLNIWPLDQYNTILLNEVHPIHYTTTHTSDNNNNHDDDDRPRLLEYDLIAIGAGAGGLVSSKQSARRNASSAMISAHLAGGDCLNVGVRIVLYESHLPCVRYRFVCPKKKHAPVCGPHHHKPISSTIILVFFRAVNVSVYRARHYCVPPKRYVRYAVPQQNSVYACRHLLLLHHRRCQMIWSKLIFH